MMKFKPVFTLALLVSMTLISGCTTVEFVRKDFTPHKQGILRHSIPSSEQNAAKYKAEADKQAREFCGGDFTIIKEYQALAETNSRAGVGTGFGFGRSSSVFIAGGGPNEIMYSFVEFSCK